MKIPSQKKEFREEIVLMYRELLKENTITLSIIDHQMAILAFSLRKLLNYKANACLPSREEFTSTKEQIFKDTWSVVNEFYPYIRDEVIDDVKLWYDTIHRHAAAHALIREYYLLLNNKEIINTMNLFEKHVIPFI